MIVNMNQNSDYVVFVIEKNKIPKKMFLDLQSISSSVTELKNNIANVNIVPVIEKPIDEIIEEQKLFDSYDNSIKGIYEMILNGTMVWTKNLSIKKTSKDKNNAIHSKYIHILHWWFSNFTEEEKNRLWLEYNGIIFDYVKDDFITWSKVRSENIRYDIMKTLKIFYVKKVDNKEYRRYDSSYLMNVIKDDKFVWSKDVLVSLYKGNKADYDNFIYEWVKQVPESERKNLRELSGLDNLSNEFNKFYEYAISSENRVTNPYKTLRTFLKIV